LKFDIIWLWTAKPSYYIFSFCVIASNSSSYCCLDTFIRFDSFKKYKAL